MDFENAKNVVPLKRTMNPKNRGNIAELGKIDAAGAQVFLRMINELEEQLEVQGQPQENK